MERFFDLLNKLAPVKAVSGFEENAYPEVKKILEDTGLFDEIGMTPVGTVWGLMKCGVPDAPTVVCDAHLDTVGFVVTEICPGGFLKVAPVGKIAPKILPASVVEIYGKETVTGVFGSTPPHLQAPGESEKKFEVTDLFVDTGYPEEKLKELVRVGTPAGFRCVIERLAGDRVVGASFDDRLCAAAILDALYSVDVKRLRRNIAFQFSAKEESGHIGAMTGVWRLRPEKEIVVDVTHAFVPGAHKSREGIVMGGGVDICFSPRTSRSFTKEAVAVAEREGIPYQLSASPGRTGTNSGEVATARGGVPVLQLSIPLKNMHTISEIFDLCDALAASKLIEKVLMSI